jgi:hypothetical protein
MINHLKKESLIKFASFTSYNKKLFIEKIYILKIIFQFYLINHLTLNSNFQIY